MSRSATRVTFSDRSTAITKSVTGKGTLPHTDPSPLVQCTEPPITGVLLGVPKFTTLTFTNVQVNGANIGTYTAAPGVYEFIRTTNGSAPPSGTVQILPLGVGAASFSHLWKHNEEKHSPRSPRHYTSRLLSTEKILHGWPFERMVPMTLPLADFN